MQTTTQFGKSRRLTRLFTRDNRAVFVPVDDSLISGPTNGLENLGSKVGMIAQASPNAIIGFAGVLKQYGEFLNFAPFILNITASTTRSHHTRKTLIGTVEQALHLGVEAVAVHVNVGSEYETEMLHNLGVVSRECEAAGMPLLGIMYPRSEDENGDNNYLYLKQSQPLKYAELVAHAARIGVEVGVDLVKTQYTGTPETFRCVVEACYPTPIVVAGGPILPPEAMLRIAYDVIQAGGAGVSFGRNIFGRLNPTSYISALKSIVHHQKSVEDALQIIDEDL